MPKKKPAVYEAVVSFAVYRRVVKRGTKVYADDPIYKGNEVHFKPVEDLVDEIVEQATAAPGEKRAGK